VSGPAIKLPAGAVLESGGGDSSATIKLPPGATLESGDQSSNQRGLLSRAWDAVTDPHLGEFAPGHSVGNLVRNVSEGVSSFVNQPAGAVDLGKQLYRHATGQPNTLADIPYEGAQQFAAALAAPVAEEGLTGSDAAEARTAARTVRPPAQSSAPVKPGALSDAMTVISPRGAKIVNALRSGDYGELVPERVQALGRLGGRLFGSGEAPPNPATPSVPAWWGRDNVGPPEMWGKEIPGTAAAAPEPTAAAQESVPASVPQPGQIAEQMRQPAVAPEKALRGQIDQLLNPSTLKPGVRIADQFNAQATPAPAAEVPADHTPVEKADSPVQSYKYDPDAREMHVQARSTGQVHVYGDVSPEDAEAFANAPSKGRAWQAMKQNVQVAKVINGKRVAIRPAEPHTGVPDDQGVVRRGFAQKAGAGGD